MKECVAPREDAAMPRATVKEVDYFLFKEKLREAAASSCLIERTDRDRWGRYVADNQIRESALAAFGKVKFVASEPTLVAIEMDDDWDGCYAYSADDEAVLKFVPGG